jgi:integrase
MSGLSLLAELLTRTRQFGAQFGVELVLGHVLDGLRRGDLGASLRLGVQELRLVDRPCDEGAERGRKTGYAFRGSASKLDYSNWRKKHWLPALELAGLAPLRFHDLRHTYASFLVAAGYSIAEIAVLMGHEDPSTTMIYAHLLPPVDPERLGRALPRLG